MKIVDMSKRRIGGKAVYKSNSVIFGEELNIEGERK